MLHALGLDLRPLNEAMLPVLAEGAWAKGRLPAGYRYAGSQAIRVDLAAPVSGPGNEGPQIYIGIGQAF